MRRALLLLGMLWAADWNIQPAEAPVITVQQSIELNSVFPLVKWHGDQRMGDKVRKAQAENKTIIFMSNRPYVCLDWLTRAEVKSLGFGTAGIGFNTGKNGLGDRCD